MAEELAIGYATVLNTGALLKETNTFHVDIEDILARVDEFETLLSNVQEETISIMGTDLRDIIFFSKHFEDVCHKIDNLELYIESMQNSVNEMERLTVAAEETLKSNKHGLKSILLKPLL